VEWNWRHFDFTPLETLVLTGFILPPPNATLNLLAVVFLRILIAGLPAASSGWGW